MYSRGFTLIELLITVVILVSLTVFAVSSYSTYRLRAKYSSLVQAAAPIKVIVQNDYFNNGYTFTGINYGSWSDLLDGNPPNLISSLFVADGSIIIFGNPEEFGSRTVTIVHTPISTNNQISWICETEPENYDYAPLECRH